MSVTEWAAVVLLGIVIISLVMMLKITKSAGGLIRAGLVVALISALLVLGLVFRNNPSGLP